MGMDIYIFGKSALFSHTARLGWTISLVSLGSGVTSRHPRERLYAYTTLADRVFHTTAMSTIWHVSRRAIPFRSDENMVNVASTCVAWAKQSIYCCSHRCRRRPPTPNNNGKQPTWCVRKSEEMAASTRRQLECAKWIALRCVKYMDQCGSFFGHEDAEKLKHNFGSLALGLGNWNAASRQRRPIWNWGMLSFCGVLYNLELFIE